MKHILLFTLCLYASVASFAQKSTEKAAIIKVLETQAAAWNKGDIEGFMKGYWNNDSLMFVSKNGVTYGYQPVLEGYKKSFPDAEKMGKLYFDFIEVKRLSADYFLVVGKWTIKTAEEVTSGHYSLVFRKFGNNWRIVADHSS